MYDRKLVVGVLGVLGFLVILPFVIGIASGEVLSPLGEEKYEAGLQALRDAKKTECVRDTREEMRKTHMQILNEWRDDVVREGKRNMGKKINGEQHEKSLTLTCLGCHSRTNFCDRCHDYAGVEPACWNCHVDPEEK